MPASPALNAVTLRLNPGEIHGLIGENGAGKSTLIKILAGVYQADSGSATLDGHPLPLGNPAAIEAAGIRIIHQELNLIPHFTVAESVFLGPGVSHPLGGAGSPTDEGRHGANFSSKTGSWRSTPNGWCAT
ncbi:sugar ABC transporter ATP-binding protein [Klebsiella pneumoniae]|uniref:Sugar ABC transporter ATP-binding protein n=1 Tax=Klebsiella pneumoniae TaxID=573 RepID=A0A377WF51_KLEPN|nr:sugar ABC transporter ATP-binding protein [Klebsiella pneumoniae]